MYINSIIQDKKIIEKRFYIYVKNKRKICLYSIYSELTTPKDFTVPN